MPIHDWTRVDDGVFYPIKTADVEPVAVGAALPALSLFLTEDLAISTPLEESYQASWAAFPADYKALLEPTPG